MRRLHLGWDLYNDTPARERAADYKQETGNVGLLSLRDEAGTTSSWLACGSEKGGQNGQYAARVWKDLGEKYYFEILFSTKEYTNIVLSAAVAMTSAPLTATAIRLTCRSAVTTTGILMTLKIRWKDTPKSRSLTRRRRSTP